MLPTPEQVWSHSTCSIQDLQNALDDPTVTAIESDILMGKLVRTKHGDSNDDDDQQPIMAHPPEKSSDLSFRQFVQMSIVNDDCDGIRKKVSLKKHLKLDIKEAVCVEPILKILDEELSGTVVTTTTSSTTSPKEQPCETDDYGDEVKTIYLNADILPGPGNRAESVPGSCKPEYFINTCTKHIQKHEAAHKNQSLPYRYAFSLGWRVDCRALRGYTSEDVRRIQQVIVDHKLEECVVLAVNARVLVKRVEAFDLLLEQVPSCQLLVWTATGEPAISTKIYSRILNHFESFGCRSRVGFDCKVRTVLAEIDLEDKYTPVFSTTVFNIDLCF